MKYELMVSKEGKEEIVLNTENGLAEKITNFEFKLNSIDDDSPTRDRAARCEIRMEGIIDDKSYNETVRLIQWAVEKSNNLRKIKIVVKDDNDNVFRTYELDNMFCVDAEEIWKANKGTFSIFIAQAPNANQVDILDFE